MIKVTLVGTGGMIPLPHRFLSSALIEHNGKSILIDCGEGTQISLSKGKASIVKIETILITHCHADHVAGLPGFLLTLGNCGRREPIYILGPKGIKKTVESLIFICGFLPFELNVIELSDVKPVNFDRIGMNITSIPLKHHLPCIGYSLELKLRAHFNPEKAKELNIPIAMWKLLHNGENAEFDDKIITPDMVLGENRKPIKISYCTDTRPTEYMSQIVEDSDLFICEGMYGEDGYLENAISKMHMLFSESAIIARDSNVKELWLTHYSPSLTNPEEYMNETKKIFKNTVVGHDLMCKIIKPTE